MRILFAYRYGILGGVCTQLINRLQLFASEPAVEAHLLFATDHGISITLRNYPHLHFEPDPRKARSLVRDGAFDAAVVIDTPEYFHAFRDLAKVPVIAEVHTTVERGLRYLAERNWSAVGFIVPSDFSKRLLRGRFQIPKSHSIDVIPNCLDMSLFPRIQLPCVPNRPVYLWVGKLDDHKNWRGFLEVASRITETRPNSEFWLVGGYTAQPDVEAEMVEEMTRRGLNDRCQWFPRIEYHAMHRVYAAVRQSGGALVVTSINESFGMSVLEALICGCPVLASEVGAIPEIAPDRPYLRFYDVGDYSSAAELAIELRADGPRSPSASARAALDLDRPWLEERFSTDTVAERYVGTLKSLVEKASAQQSESTERGLNADPRPSLDKDDAVLEMCLRGEIEELRARIPGGQSWVGDPVAVVREANRLFAGRSFRMARLIAGTPRKPKLLARLPLRLLRELTKSY